MPTRRLALMLGALALSTAPVRAQSELTLYAAGSLTAALTETAQAFTAATGVPVKTQFGPSGLMREKIEAGEHADVFASADMGHPLRLEKAGRASKAVMFTRNALCAVALPGVGLTGDTFVETLVSDAVKLGTSTPGSDPSGDYTWELFRRAEAVRPGAFAALDAKAQKIVGNAVPAAGQAGTGPIPAAFRSGAINVQISYCTSAGQLKREIPDLQVVEPPASVRTGPEYGLVVLKPARPEAVDLALFILSPDGQAILARHGFSPVGLPARR